MTRRAIQRAAELSLNNLDNGDTPEEQLLVFNTKWFDNARGLIENGVSIYETIRIKNGINKIIRNRIDYEKDFIQEEVEELEHVNDLTNCKTTNEILLSMSDREWKEYEKAILKNYQYEFRLRFRLGKIIDKLREHIELEIEEYARKYIEDQGGVIGFYNHPQLDEGSSFIIFIQEDDTIKCEVQKRESNHFNFEEFALEMEGLNGINVNDIALLGKIWCLEYTLDTNLSMTGEVDIGLLGAEIAEEIKLMERKLAEENEKGKEESLEQEQMLRIAKGIKNKKLEEQEDLLEWDFISLENKVNLALSYIENNKQAFKKSSKKEKKLSKERRDYYLTSLATPLDELYSQLDEKEITELIQVIADIQGILLILLRVVLKSPLLNVEFISGSMELLTKYITRDNEFRNLVMYQFGNPKDPSMMGNSIVISLFLFICKEKPFTLRRIEDFLSFVIHHMKIEMKVLSNLTAEQETLLTQIRTSIKYEKNKEKGKEEIASVAKPKRRKNDFSLTDMTDGFIKIKYVSLQAGKHLFHKTPVEHIREGHWRHYKTGKNVWIAASTINDGEK